jgi:hypothetical protein
MDTLGRTDLTIEPDGTARLEHHRRDGSATFSGHADLARLEAALARAGFPRAPEQRPIVPDSRLLTLTVGDAWIHVPAYDLAGYGEVFALLDALVDDLRSSRNRRSASGGSSASARE